MRVLLIVNASASSVTARARVVIQKALAADHDVTLAVTSRRGHATRLARGAANVGVEVVVVLGGDGTLNEAANGLAGTSTALAVLAGGSTNVFARTMGLPNDPIEGTGVLLDALGRGAISPVGLGSVNGRYFLFHVGMGFDAAVVREVERRSALKRYAGHPLFVYAGIKTWLRRDEEAGATFSLHHDDGTVVDGGRFALVMNTNPYTYLGYRPLDVAPDAGLERALATFTMRSLSLPAILEVLGSALGSGRRARAHPTTVYRRDCSAVTVTSETPFPYQVDGDHLGEVTELAFRHEPEVLQLVRP